MPKSRRSLLSMAAVLGTALLVDGPRASAQESETGKKIRQAVASGDLAGLHGVMVAHKGKVLVEEFFSGEDERWGVSLGKRDHGPETLHDLRSVTKSIVALLYGMALAERRVPTVDRPLLAQFPEYADLAGDPRRDAITIGHALSMQMGTEWDESLPYSDPRNSEIAMEAASDRYRFILDRPMIEPPGTQWRYNGGATAIIGRVIAKGVGKPIDAYAKKKLLEPLGIREFEWIKGRDGEPSAASGLRLKLPDLVRIGEMVVAGGTFDGRTIVPADWLTALATPRATTRDGLRYGYFWWLAPQGDPPVWVACFGNGGQRLTVQSKHGLVIAINAGNYNRPDDWKMPVKLIEGYLVPGLRDQIVGK
ncbi:MAG: serine hydrolase [Hyphomicrobiaceae bacterium]